MTKSKKMLALVIALVVMLVAVSGTLIAVLVAGNQNAQSKVHVKYTSSDVNVKVEAKYYVGSTGTDMVDKNNGNQTYIELDANTSTASLDQPVGEVDLSKENSRIVYEYKFTNMSNTIAATIKQTLNDQNKPVLPTDSYNNVDITYYASDTSFGSNANSSATEYTDQGLGFGAVKYIYVIVKIHDLLYDVDFQGDFGWTLAKGDNVITTQSVNSSGQKQIDIGLEQSAVYNSEAVSQISLVENFANDEPVFPLSLNKHFVGWYTDSNKTVKANFPLVATSSTSLYAKHVDATSGISYTYESSTKSYYVSGYTGSATSIVIADVYNDGTNGSAPVKAIGSGMLGGTAISSTTITSITFPQTLEEIRNTALNCPNVTSYDIPNDVKTFGVSCFNANSASLAATSLSLGYKITSINADMLIFNKLTNITIDSRNPKYYVDGVAVIDKEDNSLAFGCNNTTIPSYVKKINERAFSGDCSIDTFVIPEGVEYIWDVPSVSKLTIPSSAKEIYFSKAYYLKSCLTSISFTNINNWNKAIAINWESRCFVNSVAVTDLSSTNYTANATLVKSDISDYVFWYQSGACGDYIFS